MRTRSIIPALALLLGATGAPAIAQTAAPATAAVTSNFPSTPDLQEMLDYLVEDGATTGIVLGILEPDGSRRILQAGSAGVGARPLGRQTVFEIGSINKTFTGTILADMVARGQVKLDDPVQKYLPSNVHVPTRNGREITLLDLATHRSGLPRLPDNFVAADTGNPYAQYSVETVYQFLNNHTLRRDIGAEFEYSNLGVGLLGIALGRAADTSIKTLIEQRILQPLGMRMTGYRREGEMAAWLAKGYARGRQAPYWDASEAIAGAGGLRSTIDDMLLYLRAQITPPSDALGRAIQASHQVQHRFASGQAFGLNWSVRTAGGRTVISHNGGTGGFSTAMAFDPDRRTGFVMLTNAGGFEDDIGMDFMMRGAPLAVPQVQVARDVVARYAGEYDAGGGRPVFVRQEQDGTMTLRVGGNVRFRMYAESDSTFFVKRAPWRVRFTRDAAGAVSGLVLNVGDSERTARRAGDRAPTPAEEKASIRDLPLTAEEMAAYEGTYTLQLGQRTLELRVFAQGGKLMSQATGQGAFLLRNQGSHAFIPIFDNDARLVFTLENGRATRIMLYQGGQQVPGTRNPQ
jgi:D-alanyl-D-alanine-carboxypeptidase/D-alanyl-D-alanine-endopeptidase